MGDVPIKDVYEQICTFAKDCGARKVVLFGSRARGTNGRKSDIDVAIYGCQEFDILKERLEEELWSLLNIDAVNMDRLDISEELRKEIERDGVIMYEEI